jgi:hypothetical protein
MRSLEHRSGHAASQSDVSSTAHLNIRKRCYQAPGIGVCLEQWQRANAQHQPINWQRCCTDPLNAPPKADVQIRRTVADGVAVLREEISYD